MSVMSNWAFPGSVRMMSYDFDVIRPGLEVTSKLDVEMELSNA